MSGPSISLPQINQKQQKANEKRLRSKRASPGASVKSLESDSNTQPAFFIDSNPTPINVPSVPTHSQLKRIANDEDGDSSTIDKVTAPKTKKLKKAEVSQELAEPTPLIGDADAVESSTTAPRSVAPVDSANPQPRIEFADLAAEVDARVAAKEERRKRKYEKKRKRESGAEDVNPTMADAADVGFNGTVEENVQAIEGKPKKKSKKRAASNEEVATVEDATTSTGPKGAADAVPVENGPESSRKRKCASEREGQEPAEEGKKKKKSKKGKDKSSA